MLLSIECGEFVYLQESLYFFLKTQPLLRPALEFIYVIVIRHNLKSSVNDTFNIWSLIVLRLMVTTCWADGEESKVRSYSSDNVIHDTIQKTFCYVIRHPQGSQRPQAPDILFDRSWIGPRLTCPSQDSELVMFLMWRHHGGNIVTSQQWCQTQCSVPYDS